MDEISKFSDLIDFNIDKYGYHVTIVNSAVEPRYAYTIGLTTQFNFELIFAGGFYFKKDDLFEIFNEVVKAINNGNISDNQKIAVGSLGVFSLSHVDASWSKLMMLGAFDYYSTNDINAFQVVPDSDHYTLEIPHISTEWRASSDPIWQWLVKEWDYPVPENSTVITNLKALSGEAVTEVMRWETNEWEMFAGAGPDVEKEDIRVISLGTILGIDKTLLPTVSLEIGKGLWRESVDSDWNNWG